MARTPPPTTTYPLFVDLAGQKPSTRDVADIVRRGGTAALTEADRRADRRDIRK